MHTHRDGQVHNSITYCVLDTLSGAGSFLGFVDDLNAVTRCKHDENQCLSPFPPSILLTRATSEMRHVGKEETDRDSLVER